MGYARDKYEETAVGETGFLGATILDLDVEEFATVVAEFEKLKASGLIKITYVHHEDGSGMRHIDLVKFVRLR